MRFDGPQDYSAPQSKTSALKYKYLEYLYQTGGGSVSEGEIEPEGTKVISALADDLHAGLVRVGAAEPDGREAFRQAFVSGVTARDFYTAFFDPQAPVFRLEVVGRKVFVSAGCAAVNVGDQFVHTHFLVPGAEQVGHCVAAFVDSQ